MSLLFDHCLVNSVTVQITKHSTSAGKRLLSGRSQLEKETVLTMESSFGWFVEGIWARIWGSGVRAITTLTCRELVMKRKCHLRPPRGLLSPSRGLKSARSLVACLMKRRLPLSFHVTRMKIWWCVKIMANSVRQSTWHQGGLGWSASPSRSHESYHGYLQLWLDVPSCQSGTFCHSQTSSRRLLLHNVSLNLFLVVSRCKQGQSEHTHTQSLKAAPEHIRQGRLNGTIHWIQGWSKRCVSAWCSEVNVVRVLPGTHLHICWTSWDVLSGILVSLTQRKSHSCSSLLVLCEVRGKDAHIIQTVWKSTAAFWTMFWHFFFSDRKKWSIEIIGTSSFPFLCVFFLSWLLLPLALNECFTHVFIAKQATFSCGWMLSHVLSSRMQHHSWLNTSVCPDSILVRTESKALLTSLTCGVTRLATPSAVWAANDCSPRWRFSFRWLFHSALSSAASCTSSILKVE